MKRIQAAYFTSLIGLAGLSSTVYGGTTTISGAALGGPNVLYSSYYAGDAQFVSGTPDVAQLYTADLSTAPAADSPAVFIQGPLTTLNDFLGNYDLSAGSTVDPYWVLYVAADTGFATPIVSTDGGPLDDSSLIHVGGLTHGSITLADLDSMEYGSSGQTWGEQTVEYAGLETGDGGSGAGTANIDSITVASAPDVSSTLPLLAVGFSALAGLRRRFNRA